MPTTRITTLLVSTSVALALGALAAQEPAEEPVKLHACYVPGSGNVYRIRADGLPDTCRSHRHVEFSWNERGLAGPRGERGEDGGEGLSCWDLDGDGVGQPNEDASGDGDFNALDCEGPAAPFPAAYTTPNGLFSMRVDDAGIVLDGPGGTVTLAGSGISIDAGRNLLLSGPSVRITGQSVTVDGGASATLRSHGPMSLIGQPISLNGGCQPVARLGDAVAVTASPIGQITTGTPTVLAC